MGGDIGWFNVSAYNLGIMGYRTRHIDRIGREGAVFTDWYGYFDKTWVLNDIEKLR
ncbi:MAG TPA: hypothetical protein VJU17_08355 [Gemmatimonadales bacterium]|nr:hypothetical protein [Gemmatimonadales bacterium]